MPRSRIRSLARDMLDLDEVDRLISACGSGPTAVRNKALISLMAATGVRIAEALAITPKDLDIESRRLHVRRGKGGHPRHVWVHPDAVAPVRAWIRIRRKLGLEGGSLFCSLRGAKMCSSYIRRRMPLWAKAAGIKKRVHAHALRHAFACKAHLANVSLRAVQLQFGHRDLAATSKYLERIGIREVFADFDRALVSGSALRAGV